MKKFFFALLFLPFCVKAQYINTIAGTGTASFSGDGGAATAAEINLPTGICEDAAGNIYFADASQRIRKISATGIISTIAGIGTAGYSGDGGPATAAELNGPSGVCANASGDIFFTDWNNQCVRKISGGNIFTIAGTGTPGFSGDGGPATLAQIHNATGIAADAIGNIYIADAVNQRVRMINTSGIIQTVAGTGTAGYSGDGIPATSSQLYGPSSVAIDHAGNIFISDAGNNRIRKINSTGTISTVAGDGSGSGPIVNGVPATSTLLIPRQIAVDVYGNLYIADFSSDVRMVDTFGFIDLYAGGSLGFAGDGGLAIYAKLYGIRGVAISNKFGGLYISDGQNHRIRKVDCPLTIPPAITAQDTVCIGNTITASNSFSGGIWSTSNTHTNISSTGLVLGVSLGWDTITYSVYNSCGVGYATHPLYVENCTLNSRSALFGRIKPRVYPNPNSGCFTLNIPSTLNNPVSIYISNAIGTRVKEMAIQPNIDNEIKLDLESGIYILSAIVNNEPVNEKIVVW